eukprot:55390-Amphidinium_carterae.1
MPDDIFFNPEEPGQLLHMPVDLLFPLDHQPGQLDDMPEDLVFHPAQQADHEQRVDSQDRLRSREVLFELTGYSSEGSRAGSTTSVPSHVAPIIDHDIESEMSLPDSEPWPPENHLVLLSAMQGARRQEEISRLLSAAREDAEISHLVTAAREEAENAARREAEISHLLSAAWREAEMMEDDEEGDDDYHDIGVHVPEPPVLPAASQEQLQEVWPLGDESFNIFICPITHEVMTDPVVCADGHTYERWAIGRWFKSSRMSPVTGQALPHVDLVPNHSVRTLLKMLIDMTSAPSQFRSPDVRAEPISMQKPPQQPQETCCSTMLRYFFR